MKYLTQTLANTKMLNKSELQLKTEKVIVTINISLKSYFSNEFNGLDSNGIGAT